MKLYCECKDWETVARYVSVLKKTLPKDFVLTLTIEPTLHEGFCVRGVIEDSDGGLKTQSGSEPQQTT